MQLKLGENDKNGKLNSQLFRSLANIIIRLELHLWELLYKTLARIFFLFKLFFALYFFLSGRTPVHTHTEKHTHTQIFPTKWALTYNTQDTFTVKKSIDHEQKK